MKPIIIFLLVVILGFVGYDFYKDWDRFHAPEYHYKTDVLIDRDFYDQSVVMDYDRAVTHVNTFVKMQWTANDIDVRLPEDDDLETTQAVHVYSQKLAEVNYLESKLAKSAVYKSEGWNNKQIKNFYNNVSTPKEVLKNKKSLLMQQLYKDEISLSRNKASKSTLIYEVQRMLILKGYEMPLDGVYGDAMRAALEDFEFKNNLYPDGKIDVLTFEMLIN